jgi:hypothetical protein
MSESSTIKNSVSPNRFKVSGAAGWGRWTRTSVLALMTLVLVGLGSFLLWTSAAAAATTPSVTQNAWAGQTLQLSATPGATGEVWWECTGADLLLDCAPTSDTSGSYPLTSGDVGDTLFVVETGSDGITPSYSNAVGPVTSMSPSPTLSTDSPQQGQAISVSDGNFSGATSYAYQWYDCDSVGNCTTIAGATAKDYTPVASDIGSSLEAVVTADDATTVSASAAVAGPTGNPVAPTPTPKSSSAPSVSGTPQLGQTLTANVGTGTPTATSYDYQWLRCALNCTAISGAVGATYVLDDADVGDTIAVTVTAHSTAGATAAMSPRTGTVTAPSTLQIVASPTRPLVNQPVTIVGVVTSTAAGTDPFGTVAFANDGSPISGCAAVSVPATGQTVTVSCTTGFPVSSPSLSASFSPASGSPLLGSSASTMALSVLRGYSTTSLDVAAKARRGTTTTYTASVAAARNLIGPVLPSGTVSFLDHGKAIAGCHTARIKDGGATCTVHNARTGTQAISARYSGDTNFRGSASATKTVRVTAAPSKRTTVLGSVTATMQWTFHYTPAYTQIIALVVHGAHTGSAVTIHCTGRGCPFKHRVYSVVKQKRCRSTRRHTCPAPGTIDLESHFRHHNLRVHTKVTVTVTQKRYVGKYYRFAIRARRQPAVKISCLALGSTRPGVGCAAP